MYSSFSTIFLAKASSMGDLSSLCDIFRGGFMVEYEKEIILIISIEK
jgi:hypothetical protein